MQQINVDIRDKIFVGIVEDNKDPNRKGRLKVRVQGVFDTIPMEDLPYSSPYRGLAGKSFEVPAIGKIVNVIFLNDDIYDPHYIYSENYNINLERKLKSLSEDDYLNFVALLFDERTQIFSDDESFTLDYKYNKVTIDSTSINLELKDNNQKLNLGTKTADQEAVLGTNFFAWMDKFVNKLLIPTSLTGNLAAPVIRPELDALLLEYQAIRESFVSDNVFLNDDKKIKKTKRTPKTSVIKDDDDLTIDLTVEYNEPKPKKLLKSEYVSKDFKEKVNEEREKSVEKEVESQSSKFVSDDVLLGDTATEDLLMKTNEDGTSYRSYYKIVDGEEVETDGYEYSKYSDDKKIKIKKASGMEPVVSKTIVTSGKKKDVVYRSTSDGKIAVFDKKTKKFIRYK